VCIFNPSLVNLGCGYGGASTQVAQTAKHNTPSVSSVPNALYSGTLLSL
jgi:hypothetical protein